MIQVVTNKGVFNITKSLFEAIKYNNPEILMEKPNKKRKNDIDNINTSSEYKIISDQIDNLGGADKLPNDIKNNISKLSKPEKRKLNSKIKEYNKKRKNGDQSIVSSDKNNIMNDNNTVSNNNDEETNEKMKHISLKELVKSEELHKNIKETEDIAANIVRRVKGLIQSYAGLGGSHTAATKSEFNDNNDNQAKDKRFSNRYRAPLDMKDANGETQDIKDYTTYSGIGRKTKSELQLALGGFKLSPYFGYKGYNGRALKYYKLSTRKTNQSKIDEMINTMIAIKGGVYKLTNEDKLYYQQFENMVYNFLHNTVYRLEVNNDNHYNNIITIIRNDPSLRDMFEVEFNNVVQQFDTKENIISYRNKNDKIVDLLIISTPMFYQGKKIFKDLSKIASYGKQLKA